MYFIRMNSRHRFGSLLSGSAKSRGSQRAKNFSAALALPPCSISSTSSGVHFEIEMPLILWLNSRWRPLQVVQTNV